MATMASFAGSSYGNTTTTTNVHTLPLRQPSRSPEWATDDTGIQQLTTPPPDATASPATHDAAAAAAAAALQPRIATSASAPNASTTAAGTGVGTDWEAHKHIINELYMGQNLNLNEVVERMKTHGFHATPRVYKAQFARWGWSKYNCKRMRRDLSSGKAVVKSQGKSCYRVKRQRANKANKSKGLVTEEPNASDASAPSPISRPASSSPLHESASMTTTTTTPTPTPTPTSPTTTTTTTTTATTATTVVRRSSPSYYHQGLTLPYQLGHVNDTTRYVQSILTDIRSHVCNVFTHQPNWHNSRATKIGLIKAYDYLSYDHFNIAMDAFVKNEHSNGGEILRKAFLEVEDAIQTDYSSTFYFLFIDLPDLFLHYNRHDILTILLGHIKRLSGSVRLRDKISGTGFAALHALAETDPSFLQHYITTASALWCDLLSELRGPRDRSTLLAKRNYLRHARGANTAYRVGQLWDDYTILLDGVHKQFGVGHDMSRHMEDVVLSTQVIHDYFVEDFVGQNERLIQSVENKYRILESSTQPAPPILSPTAAIPATSMPPGARDDTTIMPPTTDPMVSLHTAMSPSDTVDMVSPSDHVIPIEAWDVLDRNIRSNCYHRLAYYFSNQIGDARRALYFTRRASEGWRYVFWQLEAESALLWAGRHFEAESLRRCRLEAQYFGKLPESGQMIAAGPLMNRQSMGLSSAMGIDESLFVSSWTPNINMGRVVP